MSLYANVIEHAANPPHTWQIIRRGPRAWSLATSTGTTLQTYDTKREADAALIDSPWVDLYEKDRAHLWGPMEVRGIGDPRWRPLLDSIADQVRTDDRWPEAAEKRHAEVEARIAAAVTACPEVAAAVHAARARHAEVLTAARTRLAVAA